MIPTPVLEKVIEALEIAVCYTAIVADGMGKMPITINRAKSDCKITSEALALLRPYVEGGGWMPKESFEQEGTEVIAWLSSDKGFQDITAKLLFHKGQWLWSESEDPVKRPDLIRGVILWPQPPHHEGEK